MEALVGSGGGREGVAEVDRVRAPHPWELKPGDAYGHEVWDYYSGRHGMETIEREDGLVDPYKTGNPDHLRYQRQNRARGRMAGQARMRPRYRAYVGKWFDYLFVPPSEMRDVVRGTGWRLDRVIKSGGSPLYVGVLREASG